MYYEFRIIHFHCICRLKFSLLSRQNFGNKNNGIKQHNEIAKLMGNEHCHIKV